MFAPDRRWVKGPKQAWNARWIRQTHTFSDRFVMCGRGDFYAESHSSRTDLKALSDLNPSEAEREFFFCLVTPATRYMFEMMMLPVLLLLQSGRLFSIKVNQFLKTQNGEKAEGMRTKPSRLLWGCCLLTNSVLISEKNQSTRSRGEPQKRGIVRENFWEEKLTSSKQLEVM